MFDLPLFCGDYYNSGLMTLLWRGRRLLRRHPEAGTVDGDVLPWSYCRSRCRMTVVVSTMATLHD